MAQAAKTAKPPAAADEGGVRGFLNRHPVAVSAALLVLIVGGLYLVVGRTFSTAKIESPSYYTADDGQTLFVDERDKVPPFAAKGGEAVRAVVYRDPDGGEPFALYLIKYTPDAADAARVADANDFKRATNGMLYKKPGGDKWLDGDDPANQRAIAAMKGVKLPSGKRLIMVNPG